ncbi:MATE family efflux transporter [Gloeocapsopsis dulcis]|uniref:MATE family efflux transporter n=1 Tax=Gloeocapsopsis dulcis AAB1 = 1H9 TaxID=1433147 RepID=A0A6N8FXP2_9CHRO|nr:MATE family efflux transporter [Gloeocapsopsis dulcis]MUL37900.1 MATE family efflux transporter [Gloeocapsopsis dulcis AAB1 = 1H9]WNN92294.1 MATE family efflux transporter [Gloeocapsopsis dulcis]
MTSQKQSQITNEILQGNLIKLTFKLSIPSTLGILMLSLNSFLDALFAGRFIGEYALAGISLALPIIGIVNGFAFLVGVGSASILSRAIGSGDIKTQSKIFGNLTVTSILISLIITITGYSFAEQLIVFMGASGEVASSGAEYLKIYVLGSIFLLLAQACSEVIKSEGQIKLYSIFNGVFVIVNVFLNSLFVIIFRWGTQGIALATVLAMIVYSILNLGYFLAGKSSIPVNPRKIAVAIDLLPEVLSVGASSLFYPVMTLAQSFVIFNSIAYYGTNNDIAFFGATGKVGSLVFIPIIGFAQALQPIIGMNYGARNYQRLKKAYLTFAMSGTTLLLLIWMPLQASPTRFLNLILPGVIFTESDIFNFRIINLLIPVWPLALFSNTLFQSIGKGKTVLIVILLKSIGLNIPIVLFISQVYGVKGVYLGIIFADIIFMLIVFLLTILEFNSLSKLKVEQQNL